jgi:mono/diheme cytochrome c family protein
MSSDTDHYNKSGLFMFLVSIIGSVLFFIYIAFVHPGVTGIDKVIEPSDEAKGAPAEAKVEPVDPDSVEKPWISEPGLVAAGAQIYAANCATCHGKTGKADGIASTPDTRNLVTGDWKAGNGSAQHLFTVLQNGLEGTAMVSFKASIPKNKRWAVVHYVRSITENKVDDDPAKLEAFAKAAD